MRCQFCGWDNAQEKEKCEKCNKPLSASSNIPEADKQGDGVVCDNISEGRPTQRKTSGFSPRKTVREGDIEQVIEKTSVEICPVCGYDLEEGTCSSCGYSKYQPVSKNAQDFRKTLRPIRKKENKEGAGFCLTPISEETGMPEGKPTEYKGDSVILNRNNTNPGNMTITSTEQAVIACVNGEWSIEDRSEQKTTFVQASGKIEIKNGTLILLGDQLYRFDV